MFALPKMDMTLNQYVEDLIPKLTKRLEIKLKQDEIENIVNLLPKFPELIRYKSIWQLGPGKHSPCIHNTIPDITNRIPMKNTCQGKKAKFQYNTIKEAKQAVAKINSELGELGYKACIKDNYVEVTTSEFTSISRMLSKLNFVPLFCQHAHMKEIIFFAEPFGLNHYSLGVELQNIQEQFYKQFKTKLHLPKNRKKIKCRNTLPDFKEYNPDFMEFIIKYKPKEQQLRTYIGLYQLAETGIPVHRINKRDLVRLVQKYTKMPLRTVQNHLVHSEPTLQDILINEIYSYYESSNSIKLRSKQFEYEIFSTMESHKPALEENMEGEKSIDKNETEYGTNRISEE